MGLEGAHLREGSREGVEEAARACLPRGRGDLALLEGALLAHAGLPALQRDAAEDLRGVGVHGL
eukprot:9531080-Alexandrium_andersonii.AAC.1